MQKSRSFHGFTFSCKELEILLNLVTADVSHFTTNHTAANVTQREDFLISHTSAIFLKKFFKNRREKKVNLQFLTVFLAQTPTTSALPGLSLSVMFMTGIGNLKTYKVWNICLTSNY